MLDLPFSAVSNQKQFYRAFKKATGMSPSEFIG
ncbi:MAG: AraC family transcriptional regulator [Haliscomenobacter sp.]|nr:AraC family transcriptional regulator [Haliscomenobacter sp.]